MSAPAGGSASPVPGGPHAACPCLCRSSTRDMRLSEMQFLHILVVLLVLTLIVVLLSCLLSHYRLMQRLAGRWQHQHQDLTSTTTTNSTGSGLWPVERDAGLPSGELPFSSGASDSLPQSLSSHRGAYRPAGCLRSKYPYSLAEVDLPPTISLSDGEEPPPYKGPCTLKLRAPEQQRELSREAIRAPPNRTVFDGACSPPLKARPLPPSAHAGASAATKHASGCGPPPPYSETISGFPPLAQHSDKNRRFEIRNGTADRCVPDGPDILSVVKPDRSVTVHATDFLAPLSLPPQTSVVVLDDSVATPGPIEHWN
uniref:protein TMEPAI-like isoform X2 n=1 Tax=Myxine glutinosa TaxID=7769 RepID=UPI00358DFD3A